MFDNREETELFIHSSQDYKEIMHTQNNNYPKFIKYQYT